MSDYSFATNKEYTYKYDSGKKILTINVSGDNPLEDKEVEIPVDVFSSLVGFIMSTLLGE